MMLFAICAIREVSRSRAVYRGEQYDPDLNLYYLRARYYNPLTGRFLSRDPLNGYINDPATLHKYLYAGGDPVNIMDPTGRGMFDTSQLWFKIVTTVVITAQIWVPVLSEVLECEAEAVAHSPTQRPVFRPFSGKPCTEKIEPPHDDWPEGMPPDNPGPARWPGVGDTGEAP
jgi:RHS repeat-associated protein